MDYEKLARLSIDQAENQFGDISRESSVKATVFIALVYAILHLTEVIKSVILSRDGAVKIKDIG